MTFGILEFEFGPSIFASHYSKGQKICFSSSELRNQDAICYLEFGKATWSYKKSV